MSATSKAIEADSPLRYWRLPKNSGAENKGGTAITLSGTTSEPTGPLSKGDEGATSWDGVNDAGSVAVNLSAVSAITLEFWLKWDTFANDDDLAFEYSPNYNSNKGFIVDPNAAGGKFEFGFHGEGGFQYWIDAFTRPSAGVWHHYVIQMNRVTLVNKAYVDGVEQTLSTVNHSAGGSLGTFANSTLYIMCRNAASLFGAGDMAHLAIYEGTLSKARVEAHYAARNESEAGEKRTGTVALSGGGSVAVAGRSRRRSSAAVSGGGSASAQGRHRGRGAPTVSGGGQASAAGHKSVRSSPGVSAGGECGAEGEKAGLGAVGVGGGGDVELQGAARLGGAASVSGGGSISVGGAKSSTEGAVLSGSGDAAAEGSKHATGTVSVAGGGEVSVTSRGGETASGSVSVSGGGEAAVHGRKSGAASVRSSGGGSIALGWFTLRTGSVAVAGGGRVRADGRRASSVGSVDLRLSARAAITFVISDSPAVGLAMSDRAKTTITLEDR